MSDQESSFITSRIELIDTQSGFSCGKHQLDDYFARYALANDQAGIGRAYVFRRSPDDENDLPNVLGFYTLSMALAESAQVSMVITQQLPRYPMPVALIGRLAVDKRAQGRRLGEKLLMDALRRIVDAANTIGCTGIIVDAKDQAAESFYEKYDFVTVSADKWPHRMFLPIATARAAFITDSSENSHDHATGAGAGELTVRVTV
jgi:ribosomal protein S18 acetylase RimI-like enzyme